MRASRLPVNIISWRDMIVTIVVAVIVTGGFAFEFAGETVKGWHTISWWAHTHRFLRWAILAAGSLLLVWLTFFHFAGAIAR